MNREIKKISVIGAGTLGAGIAEVFLLAGFHVVLYDLNMDILEKAKILIDEILNRSNKPPIIILQSDHGPGSLTNWENPAKTNMKERFSILNAYYLPEEGKKLLYKSITPVNTFRVIFNYLFNYDLDLLNDESYFATWDQPYKFINVTNELIDN